MESNTYASIASAYRSAGLITFGLSLYEQTEEDAANVALIKVRKMKLANIWLVKLQGRRLSPAAGKLAKYLAKRMRSGTKSDADQMALKRG